MKYDIIANMGDLHYTMSIFNEKEQTVICYEMTPRDLLYLQSRINHYLEFREKRNEA